MLPKLYDGRNRTFWTFAYEGIYRLPDTADGVRPHRQLTCNSRRRRTATTK